MIKGQIPSGFDKLIFLKYLDLSHNELGSSGGGAGGLHYLATLSALEVLDLSYNHISGIYLILLQLQQILV